MGPGCRLPPGVACPAAGAYLAFVEELLQLHGAAGVCNGMNCGCRRLSPGSRQASSAISLPASSFCASLPSSMTSSSMLRAPSGSPMSR